MDNIQVGLDSLQATQQSIEKMLSGLESKSFGKCKHEKLFKQKPHIKEVHTVIIRKVNQRSSAKSVTKISDSGMWSAKEGYTQGAGM